MKPVFFRRHPLLVYALLSPLFLSACAGPRLKLGQTAEGEVVEAEGVVVRDPSNLVGTRKKALLEAQKSAVEKVVGLYLSAKTLVEKAMLVDQNILTHTDGYIKKYDILSEKEDGNFFKTRIRALVAFAQIGRDLDALGLLKSPAAGNPRVALQIQEKIDQNPADGQWAQGTLSQELLGVGFKLVDREAAKDLGAELVILGEAQALPFQTQGLGGFVSYRATLSLRVTKAGSHEIAMSVTKEASGLGGNATLAGQKALQTVGQLAGQELAQRLASELTRRSGCLVSIEGVPDLASLEGFEKDLRMIPGVVDLFLRSFSGGFAQLEIQTKEAGPQEVANRLSSSSKVQVETIQSDSLGLKWRR